MTGSAYDIIMLVIALVVGGFALYFKYNKNLATKATQFIAMAEEMYKDVTKAGGQKFEWVVDQLYSIIPAPLKILFTREMLSTLVQKTFDAIEQYAKLQLDKVSNAVLEKSEKVEEK